MMKRTLGIVLAVLALSAGVARAQSVSKSDSNVEFRPHAYIGLQGGAAYTVGETTFNRLVSPAAAGELGYQFSPVLGARLAAGGWQGKGAAVAAGTEVYAFNYLLGGADLTLNLANLFAGYKHDRVLSPYAFVGGGALMGFRNGANSVKNTTPSQYFEYLWSGKKILPVGRAGLGTDIRLSDIVALTLEANAELTSDRFNSKKAGNPDFQFNALAGLKFNLGKPYTRKPAPEPVVYEAPKPEPAPEKPVVAEEVKPEPKKAAPEKKECKACKEMQEICTFFELDSSEILPEEAAKLDKYAQWLAKHKDVKIAITGYADVQTGNPAYNMGLSQRRVVAVKKYLTDKGIDAGRIGTDYKGDTVQPFAENEQNRVVVSQVVK